MYDAVTICAGRVLRQKERIIRTSRPRVALVTSQDFANLYEDDLLLVDALERTGIDSRPAIWSDAGIEWSSFDALVMRSPWDYFVRVEEFRAWLDARVESGVCLINSSEILKWNFDKRYLQELGLAGVSAIPTIVVPRGERPDVVALARERGWEEIVVKPTIGGGGYLTERFRLDDVARHRNHVARILADRDLMIQPFLPEILDGELSLLFFDGVYSHAALKRPASGEYRVQFQYGGTNEDAPAREEWIEGARACVEAAPGLPAYARVDGVIKDGRFLLMELEIFEPLMFLARHPQAPDRFAQAIARRLP